MIKNSYWVVPGEIMAGPFPGSDEEFSAKLRLRTLFDDGIRAFINLQVEGEMAASSRNYNENYSDIYRKFLKINGETEIPDGLLHRFSIPDKTVPEEKFMIEILDRIDDLRSKHVPIYIHCWGGIGRTATVVGCWLMRHGMATRENVVDELFRLRKAYIDPVFLSLKSPETDEQERFVLAWSRGK